MISWPGLDLGGLRAHLMTRGVEVEGPLQAEPIVGGRSNLTYLISDRQSQWVLRRPPLAGLTATAHDMAREFRVTSALQETPVPVARPVLLCEGDSVLGAPFTVLEYIDGIVVRNRDDLAAFSEEQTQQIIANLINVLVALHAVDIDKVGLAEQGRAEGYLGRQVTLWRKQWGRVHTREMPDLERLYSTLAETVPRSSGASVVHGDYRIDNAILDPTGSGEVRAIVDWELSTLGDPLTDVALMCVYRNSALDIILGLPAAWTSPRLPSPDALAHSYSLRSGRHLNAWPFYVGLAHLKVAVIAEGIAHRAYAGADAGRDARSAADAVPELVSAGLAALRHR